jgi:hypothetical protein
LIRKCSEALWNLAMLIGKDELLPQAPRRNNVEFELLP